MITLSRMFRACESCNQLESGEHTDCLQPARKGVGLTAPSKSKRQAAFGVAILVKMLLAGCQDASVHVVGDTRILR